MVIGVDAPADIEFVRAIRKIFDKSNTDTHLNITQVDQDAAWHFGLAKVTWELYRAASHDVALMTNVDSVLEPAAIYGRDIVGTKNIAGVALLSRPLVRTISDVVRYGYWRLVRRSRLRFTGLFWIYLPYYFDFIDVDSFKKIQNGTDTFMWECLTKNKQYTAITYRGENAAKDLNYTNNDLPWRQFMAGIFRYANIDKWQERVRCRQKNMGATAKLCSRVLNTHPTMSVIFSSIMYAHPYFYKGYRYAQKHPQSKAVTAARTHSMAQWEMYFVDHVRNLYNWDLTEHQRTGFNAEPTT